HFWMIDHAASPVPVHDQWQAEGEMLYVPLIENRLTVSAITHPHAEHRIIPTRLLALGLFKLNHHVWDVRLQMTINALLAAALAALVVVIASRQRGRIALIVFAAAFGALLASPLFYGNALWGFQSQFYFLLLFSIAHLDLVLRQRVLSRAWLLGIACTLFATVSMGSGVFSAAIIVLLSVWNLIRSQVREDRRAALINLVAHAVICGAAVVWSPRIHHLTIDWPSTWHTLLHCLAWPARFYTNWGAWVWLPFVLFLASNFARASVARNDRVVLAIGLWVLAQIAAISLLRNSATLVITPRYYEIFWLGLVANTLALHRLWENAHDRGGSRLLKNVLLLLAIGWIAAVGHKAVSFTQSHWRHDLAAYQSFARSQTQQVRAFLTGGDIKVLQALPYPQVPHPDPNYLARLLSNPIIRGILPSPMTDLSPPLLSRWAALARSTAVYCLIVGIVLLLIDLGAPRRSASVNRRKFGRTTTRPQDA
ncbi:MAG TPA: hypothetical protein VL069_06140, partial [Opitutus sp.]|nr:hypothetical protein [Opitutus sp.]